MEKINVLVDPRCYLDSAVRDYLISVVLGKLDKDLENGEGDVFGVLSTNGLEYEPVDFGFYEEIAYGYKYEKEGDKERSLFICPHPKYLKEKEIDYTVLEYSRK